MFGGEIFYYIVIIYFVSVSSLKERIVVSPIQII